jgi:hypothetical protein
MREASSSTVSPDGSSYPTLDPNIFPSFCFVTKSPKIRIAQGSTSAYSQAARGVGTIFPLVSSKRLMSPIGRFSTQSLNLFWVKVSVEINAVSAILTAPDFIA